MYSGGRTSNKLLSGSSRNASKKDEQRVTEVADELEGEETPSFKRKSLRVPELLSR